MPPEFVVVGHVTRDLVPGGSRLGGTALYASLTIARLGHTVGVVTRAGPEASLAALAGEVELVHLPAEQTTTFENISTPQGRVQTIQAVAPPLAPEDVPWAWLDAPVVLLGPVAGEVAPAFASRFRRSLVAAAAQGWLRRWDARGQVRALDPREALGALPPLGAIFLSREDWAGGWEGLEEACRATPILVVTQAEDGARMRWGSAWHPIPAFPTRLVDPTGAGDVFAGAFLVRLFETRDPLVAARFASAAASLSVQGEGVSALPTRREIEVRLAGGA